jgi:hypothetical protein
MVVAIGVLCVPLFWLGHFWQALFISFATATAMKTIIAKRRHI